MDSAAARLANARLATGPALVDDYLCDSDEDAETTSAEIDQFERRLASGAPKPAPVKQAASSGAGQQQKPIPQHLLDLLDAPTWPAGAQQRRDV
eukprot:418844-Prymnesium_polylepis.1